jgi:hypothetical protein
MVERPGANQNESDQEEVTEADSFAFQTDNKVSNFLYGSG